ncbi:MAG: ABC transporter ATP-binding protein [Propionibacteriaceae bacterium]|jgi:peptide/nickel transport system ATP-binding protein|nr:ABC transporter ATP-binding protein [Propionibacteriaceae bacterium]
MSSNIEPAILSAHEVSKHFRVRGRGFAKAGHLHAVDGVSLDLYAGQITALVGESGCGKSTLARLLAQMYSLTAGEVVFQGATAQASRASAFRRYVADVQLMLQDPYGSFNPVATIEQHLTRAIKVHHPKASRAEVAQIAEDLLRQVHLEPPRQFLDKFPHELSGGQLQRCSIARGLAANPKVFLADEPVSALDVSIRLGVLNLLRELTEVHDVALLYVTHDIASARYFAADTAVMYAGHMVEHGDSEAVTQTPAHPYTRLLIDSAPDPNRPRGTTERTDVGAPPSLIDPPTGCRFHPRCPLATKLCSTTEPPVAVLAPGGQSSAGRPHWAKCWLYSQAPAGFIGPTQQTSTNANTPHRTKEKSDGITK